MKKGARESEPAPRPAVPAHLEPRPTPTPLPQGLLLFTHSETTKKTEPKKDEKSFKSGSGQDRFSDPAHGKVAEAVARLSRGASCTFSRGALASGAVTVAQPIVQGSAASATITEFKTLWDTGLARADPGAASHHPSSHDPSSPSPLLAAVLTSAMEILSGGSSGDPSEPLLALLYPKAEGSARPTVSATGQYGARLYVDGEWRMVVIDDQLPYSEAGECLLPLGKNGEIWPALLAKALLKVMPEGATALGTAVHHLTGWLVRAVDLPRDPAASWSALEGLERASSEAAPAMILLVRPEGAEVHGGQEELVAEAAAGGLAEGVLYPLRNRLWLRDNTRLLRLGASTVWRGAYSDSDHPRWTAHLEALVGESLMDRVDFPKGDMLVPSSAGLCFFTQALVCTNAAAMPYRQQVVSLWAEDQASYSPPEPVLLSVQADRRSQVDFFLYPVPAAHPDAAAAHAATETRMTVRPFSWKDTTPQAPVLEVVAEDGPVMVSLAAGPGLSEFLISFEAFRGFALEVVSPTLSQILTVANEAAPPSTAQALEDAIQLQLQQQQQQADAASQGALTGRGGKAPLSAKGSASAAATDSPRKAGKEPTKAEAAERAAREAQAEREAFDPARLEARFSLVYGHLERVSRSQDRDRGLVRALEAELALVKRNLDKARGLGERAYNANTATLGAVPGVLHLRQGVATLTLAGRREPEPAAQGAERTHAAHAPSWITLATYNLDVMEPVVASLNLAVRGSLASSTARITLIHNTTGATLPTLPLSFPAAPLPAGSYTLWIDATPPLPHRPVAWTLTVRHAADPDQVAAAAEAAAGPLGGGGSPTVSLAGGSGAVVVPFLPLLTARSDHHDPVVSGKRKELPSKDAAASKSARGLASTAGASSTSARGLNNNQNNNAHAAAAGAAVDEKPPRLVISEAEPETAIAPVEVRVGPETSRGELLFDYILSNPAPGSSCLAAITARIAAREPGEALSHPFEVPVSAEPADGKKGGAGAKKDSSKPKPAADSAAAKKKALESGKGRKDGAEDPHAVEVFETEDEVRAREAHLAEHPLGRITLEVVRTARGEREDAVASAEGLGSCRINAIAVTPDPVLGAPADLVPASSKGKAGKLPPKPASPKASPRTKSPSRPPSGGSGGGSTTRKSIENLASLQQHEHADEPRREPRMLRVRGRLQLSAGVHPGEVTVVLCVLAGPGGGKAPLELVVDASEAREAEALAERWHEQGGAQRAARAREVRNSFLVSIGQTPVAAEVATRGAPGSSKKPAAGAGAAADHKSGGKKKGDQGQPPPSHDDPSILPASPVYLVQDHLRPPSQQAQTAEAELERLRALVEDTTERMKQLDLEAVGGLQAARAQWKEKQDRLSEERNEYRRKIVHLVEEEERRRHEALEALHPTPSKPTKAGAKK
jgi:hypothetical protein